MFYKVKTERTSWRVCCESHARMPRAAKVQREALEGNWDCVSCAKFDGAARYKLNLALTADDFSHTTIRGNYGAIGCVYRNDPTSPTNVRQSGYFDPYCDEAMLMVQANARRFA